VQAFKDGDVRFLICTDVAARGIDINGLPYVINMTLPDKSEDYIHRCAACARASGVCGKHSAGLVVWAVLATCV
jgi:ATP-dependent RNA helicase DDX1